MWIAKKDEWNTSHTDLSKYFIERIKQRVDYEEIISNRHRTTNGYTLIHEITEVATLTQKRIKSVHRLISLLNESINETLSSSIVNDFILQTYHSDIIDYYKSITPNKLKDNGGELSVLINKTKIFELRIRHEYYSNILLELNKVDFDSNEFNRNATIIDSIIDCLVPYLIHRGYSATSISDIAFRCIKNSNGNKSPKRIVKKFSSKPTDYCFLLKIKSGQDEIESVLSYLKLRKVFYEVVTKEQISDFLFDDFVVSEDETLYFIKHTTLDPHNYLRNIYEIGLKNYVAKKDRLSLQFFTNFFDSVHWKFDTQSSKFQKSNITIDPINVVKRKSTLTSTLETIKRSYEFDFNITDGIPIIEEIRDSLYYYNLAIGSKSIENSLSLLWTSLETLLPYRMKNNDIENVQYFVSKCLAIGAIGREVTSFISRYVNTDWINDSSLSDIGMYTSYINYKADGISKWVDWLGTSFTDENDPFDKLKENSNLLCKAFCFLNDAYTGKNDVKVNYWLDKVKSSEQSIKYQLDRIYLHRNQIVHSGKFINEYSNLWHHLEWYVGKLLSFCIISFLKDEHKTEFNKEMIFMQLEADTDALINLLEVHKDKRINEIGFLYPQITKNSWQFF
ncbi:hypothetical protein KEM09_21675 [Carboxylicivirga mesophila]|uniref:Apea-like HEPN domain-containing protein n=1 Tax=Carboxylicivirga mesophila TaxID=1166478 RepID=A0ABS5KG27_9BACT|nr:hypothetical protein [Carboxylicivirga mesophila]MBS2214033.1 hypothetical protein [Carboxylicivirga mesophila]